MDNIFQILTLIFGGVFFWQFLGKGLDKIVEYRDKRAAEKALKEENDAKRAKEAKDAEIAQMKAQKEIEMQKVEMILDQPRISINDAEWVINQQKEMLSQCRDENKHLELELIEEKKLRLVEHDKKNQVFSYCQETRIFHAKLSIFLRMNFPEDMKDDIVARREELHFLILWANELWGQAVPRTAQRPFDNVEQLPPFPEGNSEDEKAN